MIEDFRQSRAVESAISLVITCGPGASERFSENLEAVVTFTLRSASRSMESISPYEERSFRSQAQGWTRGLTAGRKPL